MSTAMTTPKSRGLTRQQAEEIRRLVCQRGWQAVRSHPTLAAAWQTAMREAKKYTDSVIENY